MLRVEIRWIDSGSAYNDGWETKESIVSKASLSEVSTVGWLMDEDDDTYYVASTYDPVNEHFLGMQLIHKPAVTGLTRLRARTMRESEDAQDDSGTKEDEEGGGTSSGNHPRGVLPSVRHQAQRISVDNSIG
jgi:hypothetical protein